MNLPTNLIEPRLKAEMQKVCDENPDPSHDILHVERVVSIARKICEAEKADWRVVMPAAYLHDCVYISKSDSRRSQASRLSADRAVELLASLDYPRELLPSIHHAISAHSFSAGLVAETLEAKIVQDADRLDAMGVVGAFRCFAFSGLSGRPLYSSQDPFCHTRSPNDSHNTLDHFYVKLLKLHERLSTQWAQEEGARRLKSMKALLETLRSELLVASHDTFSA